MAKEEKKSELAELKLEYAKFQKKYGLPEFDKINEEFDIEKLAGIETDYLLREMRKHVGERLANFLRFVELMLNPSNAPIFVFHIVKSLQPQDRVNLEESYQKIVEYEVKMIGLDMDYKEKKEAEFLTGVYNDWQQVKGKIMKVYESIVKNWNNNFKKKDKGYFG